MKYETVMILWHNKDPIYSIDFDNSNSRLCTAGSDNDVKIWSYSKNTETGAITFNYLSSLSKHTKPVNVARFSPGGNLLASGSDDGTIVVWRLNTTQVPPKDSMMREVWSIVSILRVNTDAYDLSWSSNGLYLTSASTDNTVQIWNPISRFCNQVISEHTHYVQGVCWDPLNQYLLTESSDGTTRVYKPTERKLKKNAKINHNKFTVSLSNVISKRVYPQQQKQSDKMDIENNSNSSNVEGEQQKQNEVNSKDHRMYYDERVFTFFRRPDWSPEGSLFITPTGKFKQTPNSKYQSTSYLFSRNLLNKPILHLPSNKPTFVVKFNPLLYKLNPITPTTTNPSKILEGYEYRMIFAICTSDSIVIYDTQSLKPLYIISELHYAPITDMSWSFDGSTLMVSSEDGYCSYVSFNETELGIKLEPENYPESMKQFELFKQESLLNTNFDRIQSEQLSSGNVEKRKGNPGDQQQSSNQSPGTINTDGTTTPTISEDIVMNTEDPDNQQQQLEKKQKIDDNNNNNNINNSNSLNTNTTTTTTTTTGSGDVKPKRRIQPNKIN